MAPYSCSGQVKHTLHWVYVYYVCVLRLRLRLISLTRNQFSLSQDCSTFNFGVFLLALGWGYSVVKARTERKEGNYALTLGSRGIRSWD